MYDDDLLAELLKDDDDEITPSLAGLYSGDTAKDELDTKEPEDESEYAASVDDDDDYDDDDFATILAISQQQQEQSTADDDAGSEDDYEGEDDDHEGLSGFDLDEILSQAVLAGASDVHISSGMPVSFTVLGDIVKRPDLGVIPDVILSRMYAKIVSHVNQSIFAETFDLDTSYTIRTGAHKGRRTRLSVGRSLSEVYMVFRIIGEHIPTPEELGINPRTKEWVRRGKGLILICGETGSGKALHANTVIPTATRGYVRVKDVDPNTDLLNGSNGKPVRIIDKHGVPKHEDFYEFMFSNGEHMKTSAGHLWTVRDWTCDNNGKRQWYTECTLSSHDIYCLLQDNSEYLEAPIRKISIPLVTKPLTMPATETLTHAGYCAGVAIGVHVTHNHVLATRHAADMARRIRDTIPSDAEEASIAFDVEACQRVASDIKFTDRIPDAYMRGSIKARQELLSALLQFFAEPLPDGTFLISVPTAYSRLSDDLRTLTSGLAYRVSEQLVIKTDCEHSEKASYVSFRCSDNKDDDPARLTLKQIIEHVAGSRVIKGNYVDLYGCKMFGSERLHASVHSNMFPIYGNDIFVSKVNPIADDPSLYTCFEVDSADKLYCAGSSALLTHNSTTFASLINDLCKGEAIKVITIEDPIEYVYESDNLKAFITQREVGADTRSFASGLKACLRQAPDLILIGEIRDSYSLSGLTNAGNSGHLALSTVHATSPSVAVDRLIGMLEDSADRANILSTLKSSLVGIVSQVLVKSPDGKRRHAIQCLLENNDEVADMIGKGDSTAVMEYMRRHGITMEHELVRAVRDNKCTAAEARKKTPHPLYFDQLCQRMLNSPGN